MPAEAKTRTDHRLQLDESAIQAAKRDSEEGAVTPAYGPWRDEIVRLLNDALATGPSRCRTTLTHAPAVARGVRQGVPGPAYSARRR